MPTPLMMFGRILVPFQLANVGLNYFSLSLDILLLLNSSPGESFEGGQCDEV